MGQDVTSGAEPTEPPGAPNIRVKCLSSVIIILGLSVIAARPIHCAATEFSVLQLLRLS